MTYEVRHVAANHTSLYDYDTWEVLKVPGHGDPYLVATYDSESLSQWCLHALGMSLEVKPR